MKQLLIATALTIAAVAPARSDGAYGRAGAASVGPGGPGADLADAAAPVVHRDGDPTRYMTSSTVGIAAVEA